MFVLGFTLYGTTVLIPQFVQTLLGYTAELAGMVISPGGMCLIVLMPVIGVLVGKVDARLLIGYGFGVLALSLVFMHSLSLDSSFKDIMWLRVFQASALPFLFIPINTIAYTGISRGQSNDVSGLTNLARNIGGSTGTAFVATMLARASQTHESNMTRNLTSGSAGFANQVNQLKNNFHGGSAAAGQVFGGGSKGMGGVQAAQGFIYNQLHRQSAMLAYLDIISALAVFCFLMIPLVMLIGKIKPPADGPAVH